MTIHVWGPLFKFPFLPFGFFTTNLYFKSNREKGPYIHSPVVSMCSCHVKVASHSELKHYEIKISLQKLCGSFCYSSSTFPLKPGACANEKIMCESGRNYCGERMWTEQERVEWVGRGGRETERERFAMFRQAQVSWAAQPPILCTLKLNSELSHKSARGLPVK